MPPTIGIGHAMKSSSCGGATMVLKSLHSSKNRMALLMHPTSQAFGPSAMATLLLAVRLVILGHGTNERSSARETPRLTDRHQVRGECSRVFGWPQYWIVFFEKVVQGPGLHVESGRARVMQNTYCLCWGGLQQRQLEHS